MTQGCIELKKRKEKRTIIIMTQGCIELKIEKKKQLTLIIIMSG